MWRKGQMQLSLCLHKIMPLRFVFICTFKEYSVQAPTCHGGLGCKKDNASVLALTKKEHVRHAVTLSGYFVKRDVESNIVTNNKNYKIQLCISFRVNMQRYKCNLEVQSCSCFSE